MRHDSFDIDGHYVQFGQAAKVWRIGQARMVEVRPWSSRNLRRAVYRFARYFRMEEDYDFVQYGYEGEEDDPTCRAYLFVAADSHRSGTAFGATCFRERDNGKGVKWQAMCWAWIHPFNRRKKILTDALPVLREAHGDFFPETPWSPAMAAFIAKNMPETFAKFGKPVLPL